MSGNVAPNIITDGLVLYLDAANTKSYTSGSTTWNDLSRSGINGTLTNGPTYNSSNLGSIGFDGVDDYIDNIGTINDFNFIFSEGTFSIGFWLKKFANNTRYIMCGNTATNLEKGWFIVVEYGLTGFGDNCLRFGVTGNAGNTRLIAGTTNDNTMITTNWTYCMFTCQNPDKIGQWYINGYPITTTTRVGFGNDGQGTYYTGPSTRTVNLGRVNFSSTFSLFSGQISNYTIYNRSLSATEVLQNYNATKTRYGI